MRTEFFAHAVEGDGWKDMPETFLRKKLHAAYLFTCRLRRNVRNELVREFCR